MLNVIQKIADRQSDVYFFDNLIFDCIIFLNCKPGNEPRTFSVATRIKFFVVSQKCLKIELMSIISGQSVSIHLKQFKALKLAPQTFSEMHLSYRHAPTSRAAQHLQYLASLLTTLPILFEDTVAEWSKAMYNK